MLNRNRMILGAAAALVVVAGAAHAQTIPIQPGAWEISSKVTSMTGGPPGMAKAMGNPMTIRHCVTPEQARQGMRELLKRGTQGNCSYKKLNVTGRQYSYEMVCTGQGGRGGMTVSASGSYTPNSYTATSRMVMNVGTTIVTTSTGSGRRVGPCKG